jgi:hypothetical protein
MPVNHPWISFESQPVVRFITDNGDIHGWQFHHLNSTLYSARHQRLILDWPTGSIVISGPDCQQILSLEFHPRGGDDAAYMIAAPSLPGQPPAGMG